jgi:hypothetical protein
MGLNAVGHDFYQFIPLIIRYFPILPNTRQPGGYVESQLYLRRYWPPQRSRTPGRL